MDVSAAAILVGSPDLDDLIMHSALANSKAQTLVGQLAITAANRLFDTGGGSATARKYGFDRHWRNVRTILNHNPAALRSACWATIT
jgi:alkylation response protein AidB-like acyl-CoA dehydrogenase